MKKNLMEALSFVFFFPRDMFNVSGARHTFNPFLIILSPHSAEMISSD